MVIQRISVIAALFTLVFANTGFSEEATRAKDYAYFKDTTIWPSLDINVCWERQTDPKWNNTKENRELVRKAIKRTWEKASLVRFVGWGWCPAGYFYGVRISMGGADVAPNSYGLGVELLRFHPIKNKRGVYLDFNLNKRPYFGWFGTPLKDKCLENGFNLKECIEFTAVHEFGHVLGLSHEHNRPDDPLFDPISLCHTDDAERLNVYGNTLFTEYDPDSIMNYCRQKYFGDSTLSKMDEFAVKVYYGNIPEFNANTNYLDIPRVEVGNVGFFALLKHEGGGVFSLLRAGRTTETSSVITKYNYPVLILPMVKFVANGKVTAVYKARLRRRSDGRFKIEGFDPKRVHPCTKYPEVNTANCYE
ncbi:MAG: hypothetical protein AXA67_01825 [Methylothermaceae bacteria B42]|nr:MAG: hypothetical protein AXA67_01825 [Methylothermaceae bacteria B42]HHJ37844.1 hypothetical protein [Methylothermaceae bacterium]